MNNRICSKCGTENEDSYIFCKNCGTPFAPKQSDSNGFNPQSAQYSQTEPSQNNFSQNQSDIHIGGISTEEIALFVGKKHNNIIPKFIKMEVTGSKVSWCWPVAVLSFFFGPFGASLWYFYRKMYKPAILLSVLGSVLAVITAVINIFAAPEISDSVLDILAGGDYNALTDAISQITPAQMLLSMLSSSISGIAEIATLVVCGIFGFSHYRTHCINKISNYKIYQAESPYYKFGLASIGGVSGGMLTLGIIIMVLVTNLSDSISVIISLL